MTPDWLVHVFWVIYLVIAAWYWLDGHHPDYVKMATERIGNVMPLFT